MPRSMWNGTLAFGLVKVPIGVYRAINRSDPSFDLLDRRDMSPLRYLKVNRETGEEVPGDEVVKGYKLETGRYVIVTEEDFRRASVAKTESIEILNFVRRDELNAAHFETPFFLEPREGGEKAYALLRDALAARKTAGIARVVLRTREHLAAILPEGRALILNTLRFAHEVRDAKDLALPAADPGALGVTNDELEAAGRLIDEMTRPWKPEQYRDEYRDELIGYVRRKARAGAVEPAPEPPREEPAPPPDLLRLLRKSVTRAEEMRTRPESRTA